MDLKDFKKGFLIDNIFLVTALMINGFTGLIFLSFLAQKGLLELLSSSFFIFFVLLIIETLWISYSLFSLLAKKNIEKKDFLSIFVIIPLYAISFMGQLGNSAAFTVFWGDVGTEIYNSYVVLMHMFLIYKIFKNTKKGA